MMQTQSNSQPGSQQPEDTKEKKQPKDLCHLDCGAIAVERNRYYTGKYMTARDFQDEQDYLLSHHRLHNRLFHSWGIVCGLEVTPHPQPNCRDRYVVVRPGIAIDCCGRELVLRKKLVVKVWDPEQVSDDEIRQAQDRAKAAEKLEEEAEELEEEAEELEEIAEELEEEAEELEGEPPSSRRPHGEREEEEEEEEEEKEEPHKKPAYLIHGGPFLLVLRYDEEAIEWAPALYSEQACDARHMEANRVREIACVDVLRWDEKLHAGCWPVHHHEHRHERPPFRDDCDEERRDESPSCVEPICECKYGVPLALSEPVYDVDSREWVIPQERIRWDGRRELRTPPEHLTHIVDYNWTHGGNVYLSELTDPDQMDGKLKVYFDRRLLDDPDDKRTGINEHTFVVTYHRREEDHYDLQALFTDGYPPYIENEEGSCCAVFPIDRRMLTGDVNLGGGILYVTLKCDFVLDCHHRPVDGEHLRGALPTGDGRPGGIFESWFRVIDDQRERREEERERRQREERERRQREEEQRRLREERERRGQVRRP